MKLECGVREMCFYGFFGRRVEALSIFAGAAHLSEAWKSIDCLCVLGVDLELTYIDVSQLLQTLNT